MMAIFTKYHGPTDKRGARVSASAENGRRVVVSWDDGLDVESNHIAAARAFAAKLGWAGRFAGGGYKYGYAFVLTTVGAAFEINR